MSIILLAASAIAEQTATRVRLTWTRGERAQSCLDRDGLRSRVRERLGRDPFADEAPLAIEGDVVREGNVWRADIRIHGDGHVLIGRRQLDAKGTDCKALDEAVTLAVALTIDPNAAARSSATPSAAFPPAEPTSSKASPAAEAPPEPPQQAAVTDRRSLAEPQREPAGSASLEVAGRGGIAAGILPKVAPLAGVGASYGDALRFLLDVWWLPEQETQDGQFAFGLTFGSAGGCYGVTAAPDVAARLCAELQVGAMHAVVVGVEQLVPLAPGDHLWVAAGAGPRLSWQIHAPLLLEAGLVGVVPIHQKTFAIVGSSDVVFESAPISGFGYVGIGVGVD